MNKQQELTKSASLVLNYIKKHNCCIRMRWSYGIQIHRVWKDEKELAYPFINEDTWCEISDYFERDGDYQQTHFYYINNLINE
jgi:hypothetical protein